MLGQRAIDRDEAQIFHLTLREEKAIERIAGCWFGLGIREDMMTIYVNNAKSHPLKYLGQESWRHTHCQFSEPYLDCYLPKARDARMEFGSRGRDGIAHGAFEFAWPFFDQGDQDMRIKQEAHEFI
jgi:hypothetical protein